MADDTQNSTTETPEAAPAVVDAAPETTALGSPVDAPADTPPADAPAADAPVVTKAPEKYELAIEGMDLDAETLAEAEPVFRELDLSNEDAGKFLPIAAKFAQKISDNVVGELLSQAQTQRKNWLDEAKADETIGGAKWEETLHIAAKGLDAVGYIQGHPFRQALEETGFGNNVHMISMARKLGELLGEDSGFVKGDAASKVENVAAQMYPNDVKGS
jgi:hypothetical protein